MRVVGQFPRAIREIENCWIDLGDSCRLAARIWLPLDAEKRPVPAILEYLPYRKRDGTEQRDELTHPYFAGHGYACVRVDMRGNGESQGLMFDEYLKQEQDDALEVINWITNQEWCSGQVGMIGISWGGFNGLQVAARQPEALKAIVTICSTDDRYEDDIHFKGGCLLNENLGWAATMLAFSSRPPDPELVGEAWREMWLNRLAEQTFLAENWLDHQRRDAFWKHGSVCEDFAAIKAAVFAVGGWGDAYSNAVPRLLSGLSAPCRGLVGPWIHKYPHFAKPEPAIGFLQECLRWWDFWLKGEDTGIMDEPLYRAYMMDGARPAAHYEERSGRWIAEEAWPPSGRNPRSLYLCQGSRLGAEAGPSGDILSHCSPQTVGMACGEYCAMWAGPEWPGEQRYDDAGSLCFDSNVLTERLEMFGAPEIHLDLEADKPQAFVAVRLCDVAPDGASTRVTLGILNLSHREGHESPEALVPGKRYRIRLRLDDVAYAFPTGHRLRLAISTSYWPLIWPSAEAATIQVHLGESRLDLPVREARAETLRPFEDAECAPPLVQEVHRPVSNRRWSEFDWASGESRLLIKDDFGLATTKSHGLTYGGHVKETYSIHPEDPLCARAECNWLMTLARGEWSVRIESSARQWSDQDNFFLEATVTAYEGAEVVSRRQWKKTVPRDFM
ncbi:MAG: CocE/NonD family hydrolase [Pseudomonadota bacterium]